MKKFVLFIVVLTTFSGCDAGPTVDYTVDTKPIVAELDCGDKLKEYKVAGTGIEFCYDTAWGEPEVTEMPAQTGKISRLTFAKNENAPQIWYESADFKGTGGDVTYFCFTCPNFYGDEEHIKASVVEFMHLNDTDFVLRKTDVSGKRGVRVHYNYTTDMTGKVDKVTYYVPEAFAGYNMTISANVAQAELLDDFMYGMVLR